MIAIIYIIGFLASYWLWRNALRKECIEDKKEYTWGNVLFACLLSSFSWASALAIYLCVNIPKYPPKWL